MFSKLFTLAASINAMTGYSTGCSVHWFFGGKSAKMSVKYKRLIVGAGSVHVFEDGDVNFVVASSTEFASNWYR